MIDVADVELTGGIGSVGLSVTPQTEITIANRQQLCVHGAVGIMAGGAAFAQRGMFKNERPGLLAVALGTGLV